MNILDRLYTLIEEVKHLPLDEVTKTKYAARHLKDTRLYMETKKLESDLFREGQLQIIPYIRKNTPPTFLQRLLYSLKQRILTFRYNRQVALYGSNSTFDTYRPHDSTKKVTANCGYCGAYIDGNAIRKGDSVHLPSHVLDTSHGKIEVMHSHFPIRDLLHCQACGLKLSVVHLTKVSKTVWAVLL